MEALCNSVVAGVSPYADYLLDPIMECIAESLHVFQIAIPGFLGSSYGNTLLKTLVKTMNSAIREVDVLIS